MDAWADKAQSLVHASQPVIGSDYAPSLKRESLFLDRESQLDPQIPRSGLSLYGQDPALSGLRSSTLGRGGALVTQVHFILYIFFLIFNFKIIIVLRLYFA